MIIHCTRKLAPKIPDISSESLEETSPLGSWTANLLRIDRIQCVMFCHDETRYALFLPGVRKPQFQELGRLHRELFLGTLIVFGVSEAQLQKVALALGPVRYDTTTDRSVLASMNQMEQQELAIVMWRTKHVSEVDPLQASVELSHRPATVRGKFLWPEKAMLKKIQEL